MSFRSKFSLDQLNPCKQSVIAFLLPRYFIIAHVLWLATGTSLHAQTSTDKTLYAADLTIRTLDMISTHTLLNAPCRCWVEKDPIAPSGKALLPMAVFQYGMALGVIASSRLLERHHHSRLSKILLVVDITTESYAVQHNMRLHR